MYWIGLEMKSVGRQIFRSRVSEHCCKNTEPVFHGMIVTARFVPVCHEKDFFYSSMSVLLQVSKVKPQSSEASHHHEDLLITQVALINTIGSHLSAQPVTRTYTLESEM